MILLSKLLNEDIQNDIKVVYPGRFQPFSLHHLEVYRNFVKKYGEDSVCVITGNKTDPQKSPFNFAQKKEIMKLLGVPADKVIEVQSTYAPIRKDQLTPGWENILNPGDKLIVVLGKKDADRLQSGGYYQPFTSVDTMEDYTQHGYVTTHQVDIKYKDELTGEVKELNGTAIRDIFTNTGTDMGTKFKQFKSIYTPGAKRLFNYMYKILNKKQVTESMITEIKHIEDLKPKELLDLLDSWNADDKKFEVTEKVDGQGFRFGINEDGFYVKSRMKTFTDVGQYPPLYFFDEFKRYHSILQDIDFISIIDDALDVQGISEIEFTGEAIPSYDSNIILYDKGIIGDGVYIVFDIAADGARLSNFHIKKATDAINKESDITFYPNFVVDAQNIQFEEKYITTLKTIIKKYGNILSRPVRNPLDKALKEKVKKIINLIGKQGKDTFLGKMSDYKSPLGGDIEGVVIKLPDNNLVKIVDKDKFTASKKLNWKYMDAMGTSYRAFKREIKKNPSVFKASFDKLSKDAYELYNEFKQFGDNEFTIPKKKEDTIKSFKIHFDKLNKIKSLLGAEDDETLINKILTNTLDEALVMEGGNTFPNMSAIKNQYVVPTTNFGLENINMSDLKFALTGNWKKPILGDIDIAVDATQLAQIIGSRFDSLEDKPQFFSDLDSYIQANSTEHIIDYKINKGLQQFSFAVPAVDDKNNFIPNTDVQLDVMIGDREWMRRALGPAIDSKYKAAHRNFLYTSAFSQIEMETGDVDVKRKYQFGMKQGVETVDFTYNAKGKRVKLGKNLLTGNVEDMVHILFDESVSFDDVNSFEELYKMMLTNKFKYPELRDGIFTEFVKTVKNMKLPVPTELKAYE